MKTLADPVAGAAPLAPPRVTGRESARDFADRVVAPVADEVDRTERVSPAFFEHAAAAGLWATLVPEQFGGAGLDMAALGAVHEEVGRASSPLRNLLTVHNMATWAIGRWGDEGQQRRWLPAMASGEVLGAFCVSEPGGGAAMARVRAAAVREGGDWVISGCKKWITGGMSAGLLLVFALAQGGVVPFLVPRRTPGVAVRPITGMLGARGSLLAEITFDDARVPADALLGPERFADGAVMAHTLDVGRFTVAAGSVGILQGCVDACIEHANRRQPSGHVLSAYQLIRAKISDMVTSLAAARLLVEQAARSKDAGSPETVVDTWIAKHFAARAAASAASEAVQILGAEGCGPDSAVARYYRDAKIMEIIEGSSEIHQITLAAHVLRGRSA
jgi:alkylation response protein AidB-like acyl-CoA dehydrogenase